MVGVRSPREVWAKAEAAARRGALEARLAQQVHAMGLPTPEREFFFAPPRRWRVDFAWPPFRLLVEVEGLTRDGGRHQQIAGFDADARKYASALLQGWTVLRLSPGMVRDGTGVRVVANLLRLAADRSGGTAP